MNGEQLLDTATWQLQVAQLHPKVCPIAYELYPEAIIWLWSVLVTEKWLTSLC